MVIVQRAGDVIPQVVGPVLPHAAGTKPFRMPERLPAVRHAGCPARGRGEAPLPQPRLPLSRPRDAEQLGHGGGRHRGRRRAVRLAPLESRPRPLAARPLPAHEGAAARARRLPGEERVQRDRRDPGVERRCRSVVSSSASTSRTSAGCTARSLARHFGTVERLGAATQEEVMACEGIGPERAEAIVEWFADEANQRARRRALAAARGARGGAADGRPADRQAVRDHRNARGIQPRGGQGRARGAWRQGLGLRLEEDDRRDRRREPGLEGCQGRRRRACRSSPRPTSSALLGGLRPTARLVRTAAARANR